MRRVLYIIFYIVGLLAVGDVEAQIISLGERTPRFRKERWLNGNEPQKCDFTYIEFIHSASVSCRNTTERIHNIVREFENIAFVLISHQSASEIDHWVTEHIDTRSGVIIDDDNIRISFGVNYAPYAVILDHKRRALWFGNPQLLNRITIEKLTENGKRKTEN